MPGTSINAYQAGTKAGIGMTITLRHDDEVWRRYLLTVPQCADALRRHVGSLKILTTRDAPGRMILGKEVGFQVEYVDRAGRDRVAWIESIEDGPVLQGKGNSTFEAARVSLSYSG